ncbi:MAG TPA: hypothetical protein VE665_02795, partial [Hyphomicrobiaceae bacterium]|nr:hypothetical protein [Hyphomicrobiaceae bacterium]
MGRPIRVALKARHRRAEKAAGRRSALRARAQRGGDASGLAFTVPRSGQGAARSFFVHLVELAFDDGPVFTRASTPGLS